MKENANKRRAALCNQVFCQTWKNSFRNLKVAEGSIYTRKPLCHRPTFLDGTKSSRMEGKPRLQRQGPVKMWPLSRPTLDRERV